MSKEDTLRMNNLLITSDDFVVLDLETSGLSPDKGARIIEIGAVRIKNGEITARFSQLINPEQKVYAKTIELTGITNEMLEGKPVYGKVLPEFAQFIGDSVVVAHNLKFDWDRFLLYFFPKVGIQMRNLSIDTVALAKKYFPEKKKVNLAEMTQELGISMDHHHRALDDAEATGKMLMIFKQKYAKIEEIEETQTLFEEPQEAPQPVIEKALMLKVKRVRYWEKKITKNKFYRRVYVMLVNGSVYFDIPSKTWYNKDVPGIIDFKQLESSVLRYLSLHNVDELCDYRN